MYSESILLHHTSLSAFVVAALIVLLIPGPGVLYVVTRSISQGRKAGLVSVLGLSAGALVHVVAAAAGLSVILLTSAMAFGVVKLLGACYLIYLGIRALLASSVAGSISAPTPDPTHQIFIDGVLISILNPKIAIFFLAFLPQFVSPEYDSIHLQFLLLGLLYVLLALVTDGGYAILASHLRHTFGTRFMQGSLPDRVSGLVYLVLGMSLLFEDRRL